MKSSVHNRRILARSFEVSLSNGSPEASVAVVERDGHWPDWLLRHLVGRQDVLVLGQRPLESRDALARRVARRSTFLSSPVRQVVWVAADGSSPRAVLSVIKGNWSLPGTANGVLIACDGTLSHYVESSQGDVLLGLDVEPTAESHVA